jgi:arylsulfatase A-like enzyme
MKSNRRVPAVMALLTVVTLLPAGCGVTPAGGDRPSILLLLVDTFRSDHMSCAGYGRPTTPVMDSLAAEGTAWLGIQGQSSWTLPAMTSIMTGLTQRSHMAGWRDGGFFGIDPALPTLAMLLNAGGYQTAAFFNVIFMNEDFGFHRGFEYFDCRGFVGDASTRNAAGTVEDFLAWYDSGRDPSRPLFAALHFFDPHLPYSPPAPWNSLFTDPGYEGPFNSGWGGRDDVSGVNSGEVSIDSAGLANLIGLYDGELAFTDHQIGVLLDSLKVRGALEGTLVVIIGDHGEEFMDHGGIGHGHTMYQELLTVPLIMAGTPLPGGVDTSADAAQIDVLPTLLTLAGAPVPAHAEGRDLFSVSGGIPPRVLPSSNRLWVSTDLAAVRCGDAKVIGNPSLGMVEGFDLATDPGEDSPGAPDSALTEALELYWSQPPLGHPLAVPFAEAVERTLRDLGYLR